MHFKNQSAPNEYVDSNSYFYKMEFYLEIFEILKLHAEKKMMFFVHVFNDSDLTKHVELNSVRKFEFKLI